LARLDVPRRDNGAGKATLRDQVFSQAAGMGIPFTLLFLDEAGLPLPTLTAPLTANGDDCCGRLWTSVDDRQRSCIRGGRQWTTMDDGNCIRDRRVHAVDFYARQWTTVDNDSTVENRDVTCWSFGWLVLTLDES
jgi:hypothetical protein